MYTMVLMMAATGGGDTAAFGFRNKGGCTGSCHGGEVVMAAPACCEPMPASCHGSCSGKSGGIFGLRDRFGGKKGSSCCGSSYAPAYGCTGSVYNTGGYAYGGGCTGYAMPSMMGTTMPYMGNPVGCPPVMAAPTTAGAPPVAMPKDPVPVTPKKDEPKKDGGKQDN